MEAGSFLAEHMADRKPTHTHFGVGCTESVPEVEQTNGHIPTE